MDFGLDVGEHEKHCVRIFYSNTCANAISSVVGGGALAIGGGIYGVATAPSGVGIGIGVTGIVTGVVGAYQGYTALANGAC